MLIIHFTPVFTFDRLPQFLKRIDLPLLSHSEVSGWRMSEPFRAVGVISPLLRADYSGDDDDKWTRTTVH